MTTTTAPEKDFHLTNHLSFYTLLPLSDKAKDWVEDNLPADRQTLGNQVYIDTRYVGPVVDGIRDSGMSF